MRDSNMLSMYHNTLDLYKMFTDPICEEYHLSPASYDILIFLGSNSDYNTAKDITKWRGIKPNMVSLHVEKLVNDGFLERQSIIGDRRQVKLVCTAKAEPVINQGRRLLQEFFNEMSEGLTEEEIEVYKKCIRIFRENIVQMKSRHKEGLFNHE